MINFYYWPTPNARKVSILFEELNLNYNPIKIDINKGDQFSDEFLNISPNNKIPAIEIVEGKEKISLFESGAILLYFAEKHEKFFSNNIVINNAFEPFDPENSIKLFNNNGFDYLLNIPFRQMTKTNLLNLQNKIKKIKSELSKIKQITNKEMWLDDLKYLN